MSSAFRPVHVFILNMRPQKAFCVKGLCVLYVLYATVHVRRVQVMLGNCGDIRVSGKIMITVVERLIVLLIADVHGYGSVEQKSERYQFRVQISCYDMSAHLDILEDAVKIQITAFFEFIVIVVSHLAWLFGSDIKK